MNGMQLICFRLKHLHWIGLQLKPKIVLQIARCVIIENEIVFLNLNGHEISAPNVFCPGQIVIGNSSFLKHFYDMSVQNWAFLGQDAGEIDAGGEVVGDHKEKRLE